MKFITKLKLSVILAFLYASVGFYILYFDGDFFNSFFKSDYLSPRFSGFIESFIIFPSHIFGSLTWFVLSGADDNSKYYIWFGQLIGFFIYALVFYFIIKTTKKIIVNIQQTLDSDLGINVTSPKIQSVNELPEDQISLTNKTINKMSFYISPLFWLGLFFIIIGLKLSVMKISESNSLMGFFDLILGIIMILLDFYIRGLNRSFGYKIGVQIFVAFIMLMV